MEIQVVHEPDYPGLAVFRIKGEINANTADRLRDEARKAYESGDCNLLLDLSEVSYISSWGIRALSEIFEMLRAGSPAEAGADLHRGLRDGTFKSGHLRLYRPTEQVRKVLNTAGVDMFLETFTDYKAALAAFSGDCQPGQ
jgi:anti-anti-sigma factor